MADTTPEAKPKLYRHKDPEVWEARKLDMTGDNWEELRAWCGGERFFGWDTHGACGRPIFVADWHPGLRMHPGMWLIENRHGAFISLTDEAFKSLYEEA